MRTVNLPTDLLRTFITVIEVKSHTRAADLLNRSQPAVSHETRSKSSKVLPQVFIVKVFLYRR